jgi:hypothetical protein
LEFWGRGSFAGFPAFIVSQEPPKLECQNPFQRTSKRSVFVDFFVEFFLERLLGGKPWNKAHLRPTLKAPTHPNSSPERKQIIALNLSDKILTKKTHPKGRHKA